MGLHACHQASPVPQAADKLPTATQCPTLYIVQTDYHLKISLLASSVFGVSITCQISLCWRLQPGCEIQLTTVHYEPNTTFSTLCVPPQIRSRLSRKPEFAKDGIGMARGPPHGSYNRHSPQKALLQIKMFRCRLISLSRDLYVSFPNSRRRTTAQRDESAPAA